MVSPHSLVGSTVRRLVEEPDRWTEIVGHPGLIPKAVEETLRCDLSVPAWRGVTTRPVTLAGTDLPAGAGSFLRLASAGRNEAVSDHPGEFDLHRP